MTRSITYCTLWSVPRHKAILGCFFLILSPLLFAVDLPGIIDFGRIDHRTTVRQIVDISNDLGEPLYLEFMSTSPSATVDPPSVSLDPGGSETIEVAFDPRDYEGSVEKMVMIRANVEAYDRGLLRVRAMVDRPADADSPGCSECELMAKSLQEKALQRWLEANWIVADVYYTEGCRTCRRLMAKTLPSLERELNLKLSIRRHNVLDAHQYELFLAEAERSNLDLQSLPLAIIEGSALAEAALNKNNLRRALATATGRSEE